MNKKLLITLVCAGLLIMAVGCNSDKGSTHIQNNTNNEIACPSIAKCTQFPDGYLAIRFDEPTQLGVVLDSLQPSQKIFRMEVLDGSGLGHIVALSGAYNNAETILQEYKSARDEMTKGLLLDLESWNSRSPDVGLEEQIASIRNDIETEPDISLLIVQVAVMEE